MKNGHSSRYGQLMSFDYPMHSEDSHSSPHEEICSSCGLLLDVTDEVLFALVKCPRCRAEVHVRRRFGAYELTGILGQGGSSTVFRAHLVDSRAEGGASGAEVALKVIEKRDAEFGEALLLLKHEANHARFLDHPKIVKTLGLLENETGAGLVMELMEGGSLHDLILSGNPISEERLLQIGLEILKALKAASSKDIIHHDLKPANILFTASGVAKLGDFGLARSSMEESPPELHLMATPDYVAPEILSGQAGDFRSDLYGLGGCLYHAFTGHSPYQSDGLQREDLALLKRRAVRKDLLSSDLLMETRKIILKLLDSDPEKRFQSHEALEFAFCKALDHRERRKGTHGRLRQVAESFRQEIFQLVD